MGASPRPHGARDPIEFAPVGSQEAPAADTRLDEDAALVPGQALGNPPSMSGSYAGIISSLLAKLTAKVITQHPDFLPHLTLLLRLELQCCPLRPYKSTSHCYSAAR